MAQLSKVVKCPTHVNFFLGGHIKQRQVNRAPPRMPGVFHDVLLREQHILIQFRIEILLHPGIVRIQCPVHEVCNCFLRPVGIIDFQAVALLLQIITHFLQRGGRFLRKEGKRFFIAVDTVSHKVVCGVIADLKDCIGNSVGQ